jgi:hypothetical protein
MYPLDSLYVKDNKYNKRAVCIAYSIWPFSSFLPVEGDLPGRCGSTLSQRVAKSFVSESDVASTLPVPHPEQKWSNAARKSYLAGPKDQCRAFVGSTGSSLASKRKIYLSEKRKVMVKTTFIPFVTALLTKYITSPTPKVQHTAAIVYGATLLLNGILFNTIWWYAVWKRRLVRRDLDAQAVQRITRGYLFGLPFYALSIVLSLINVELSLAFYILIDLMYGLPIHFLRFLQA